MFEYFLYRFGQFIALRLPVKVSYALAIAVADINYLFSSVDRKAVFENLKAIFPDKATWEIRKLRRAMARNFAKYLVDFFRFPVIDKKFIENNVRVENLRYIDDSLKKGKGIIILSAHIGNWELGAAALAIMGYPIGVVALAHKNKEITDFFNAQRESTGVKVILLGKAVRQSISILRENKILALVGDRDFSGTGIPVDFFGKPTLIPAGPAALALKTGAAIIPGFVVRNKDRTATLHLEKPIECLASGDKEKDILNGVMLCVHIMEDYIRKHPEQWFMFRKFWI